MAGSLSNLKDRQCLKWDTGCGEYEKPSISVKSSVCIKLVKVQQQNILEVRVQKVTDSFMYARYMEHLNAVTVQVALELTLLSRQSSATMCRARTLFSIESAPAPSRASSLLPLQPDWKDSHQHWHHNTEVPRIMLQCVLIISYCVYKKMVQSSLYNLSMKN